MGGGIAKSMREQFPEAYHADLATKCGSKEKLGTFSFADIQRNNHQFIVVNAYTQFHWSGTGLLADYDAIRQVFSEIKSEYAGSRIAYPKIGAGLAHGDWLIIASIIDEQLHDEDHTLVNCVP